MGKVVYFISDVHLGLENPEKEAKKENLLVGFLNHIKGKAEKLYILGDLFDYWFEYREVIQKGNFRTLNALWELSRSGTEIQYFIGNHDFLHRDFFEKEIGIILRPEPITETIHGKKFFLGHGDGFVKNDYGYLVLKAILRNKFIQSIYSLIHPDLGIYIAKSTSKKSREYTAAKDYGEIDGLCEASEDIIRKGADYVIFGHTHMRMFKKFENGYYINLGTWLGEGPCYGVFENNKFEIIDWG